jgi:hypothetical protein
MEAVFLWCVEVQTSKHVVNDYVCLMVLIVAKYCSSYVDC